MFLRHILRYVLLAQRLAITAAAVLLGLLLFRALPLQQKINTTAATLLDCKGHGACLPSEALAIVGSVRRVLGLAAQAAPKITDSIQSFAKNSSEASQQTASTARSVNDLVRKAGPVVDAAKEAVMQLTQDLKDLDSTITSLSKDADELLKSSDETIRAGGEVLKKLAGLESQLQAELAADSPEVTATLEAIQKLVSDPALDQILKNIEKASEHGADVVETLDIATRDLRKKVGRVKWLLQQIFGMVKVTHPL